jgi:hypothetical protein
MARPPEGARPLSPKVAPCSGLVSGRACQWRRGLVPVSPESGAVLAPAKAAARGPLVSRGPGRRNGPEPNQETLIPCLRLSHSCG